jgi:hypothetical protein
MTLAGEPFHSEPPTGVMDLSRVQERVANGLVSLETHNSYDFPTGLIPNARREVLLPPPAEDVCSIHDLEAEAAAVIPQNTKDTEVRMLPPATNRYDAIATVHALQNPVVAKELERTYGKESYDQALAKALAVSTVAIANVDSVVPTKTAFEQYARLRQGREQDRNLTALDPTHSVLDPFVDRPLYEVPRESLAYNPEESRVVLDALRYSFVHATTPNEALASGDVLARSTAAHSERAFYRAFLEEAGVNLSAGNLPEYTPHY